MGWGGVLCCSQWLQAAGRSGFFFTNKELDQQRPGCPNAGLASKRSTVNQASSTRKGDVGGWISRSTPSQLYVLRKTLSSASSLGAMVPSASRVIVWTEGDGE